MVYLFLLADVGFHTGVVSSSQTPPPPPSWANKRDQPVVSGPGSVQITLPLPALQEIRTLRTDPGSVKIPGPPPTVTPTVFSFQSASETPSSPSGSHASRKPPESANAAKCGNIHVNAPFEIRTNDVGIYATFSTGVSDVKGT